MADRAVTTGLEDPVRKTGAIPEVVVREIVVADNAARPPPENLLPRLPKMDIPELRQMLFAEQDKLIGVFAAGQFRKRDILSITTVDHISNKDPMAEKVIPHHRPTVEIAGMFEADFRSDLA